MWRPLRRACAGPWAPFPATLSTGSGNPRPPKALNPEKLNWVQGKENSVELQASYRQQFLIAWDPDQ